MRGVGLRERKVVERALPECQFFWPLNLELPPTPLPPSYNEDDEPTEPPLAAGPAAEPAAEPAPAAASSAAVPMEVE